MMPVIRLNDATFADLSVLKTWYGTKTPSETIDRIVREAMEQLDMERDDAAEEVTVTTSDGAMHFDAAPGLAFTKPLAASINGKALHSPCWSALLLTMITQVKTKGLSGDKLVRELAIPAKVERYDEEGFKFRPDLGISVQGQSASDCWKEVERLSKKWAIPVSVKFWWKQNPKAQYPGKTGILRSGPASA
ncbi:MULTISPECIES: T4SS efffector SepA family protein [Brucella]|uniref:T4SS efffector SepA family protein n=1 Tax=Brucella TaxID=234 RepID=UPI0003B96E7A|nr:MULTISPECIES: hypothetical protein [Brucella]ARZ20031.1 hypothetical protein BK193_07660 [Brucella melitensis]ERT91462.1 hypothetical protein P040_01803 [Brucella melitensis 11-1823-3434]